MRAWFNPHKKNNPSTKGEHKVIGKNLKIKVTNTTHGVYNQ